MKSDTYRKGYSLESLRAMELVPLTTDHARNGTFIHDSLKTLFRILNSGFPEFEPGTGGSERLGGQMLQAGDMWVDALNSPLFDDSRLELLNNVRFSNHVLQQVLQLLSLSGEKKRKSRGRISYAQLGINQLGAVYEGLLSYTGFFATEDLHEVAAEKDCATLSGKPLAEREALKTYFVPASRIGDYKDGEIVKDENDRKVVHKKGTFIFRLAGRNREKSASYYTPEVLTRCLVKYALKELLWEEGEEGEKPRLKRTADEILVLTICEPAMGSSAFLIEAVDQLADAYLEARQEEVKANGGETIPPEDYQREKRRVKARARHQQLLRRGPEPNSRRARQGLPLARHPTRGRQVPLVRPAPRHRQQPGGRPPRGLQDGRRHPQGHEGRPQLGSASCPSPSRSTTETTRRPRTRWTGPTGPRPRAPREPSTTSCSRLRAWRPSTRTRSSSSSRPSP